MADPTKDQPAPAAKPADVAAKPAPAPAPAPAPSAPATHADTSTVATMAAIAEAMKGMQQRVAPAAPTATEDLDKTQPGGMYLVGGKKVNANGRELNDDGSIKHPEQLRVNEFGQLV